MPGLLPERLRKDRGNAMPAFIANFVDTLKGIWSMSVIQRVAVAGGAVALLAAVIDSRSGWADPNTVLYSNLGAEDASHVVKALQTDKIPYPAGRQRGHHHGAQKWSTTSASDRREGGLVRRASALKF